MVTKREKELKERIGRCMVSMALSDNLYANTHAMKLIMEDSRELRAIKKEKSLKDENDITKGVFL